jgi:hypothetical protein
MASLSIGSTWLVTAANTLGPLVALLIGFTGKMKLPNHSDALSVKQPIRNDLKNRRLSHTGPRPGRAAIPLLTL